MRIVVAAIQMTSGPAIGENLRNAEELIHEAAQAGARIIGLPENFAFFGDSEKDKIGLANEIHDSVVSLATRLTAESTICILAGGYPVLSENYRVFNRATFFSGGRPVHSYDKIHLFDVDAGDGIRYRESETVQPGSVSPGIINIDGWKNSSVICYDLRFPYLFERCAGNDIFWVPSAFTSVTGESHWEILLRARAIEMSSFIVAPAQSGTHPNGRRTWGHAMIVDPWGRILSNAGPDGSMALAELDRDQLHEIRAKLPSLLHRRMLS